MLEWIGWEGTVLRFKGLLRDPDFLLFFVLKECLVKTGRKCLLLGLVFENQKKKRIAIPNRNKYDSSGFEMLKE